jgi:hypothetical protein
LYPKELDKDTQIAKQQQSFIEREKKKERKKKKAKGHTTREQSALVRWLKSADLCVCVCVHI